MKDNDMIFDEFDRDLKKSLDAAFDMNDISVSEELIASTLSKINLIKDKTGETGNAEDESNSVNKYIVYTYPIVIIFASSSPALLTTLI